MSPVAFTERVTSIAQLHELRCGASRWLSESDTDEETIETVALVLSETCTNALTHGSAEVVDVSVTIELPAGTGDTGLVTICTGHDDRRLALLPAVPMAMPAPAVIGGRGLALVDLLVDGMTLQVDPPRIVRKCWLRTRGRPRRR